jgi:8-oxo-dGTP pyrophosphatase MutT (NUDIX family)
MVAGSILPVTIHQNKLYFLFGKENPMEDSAKGFSDFGGGLENNETPLQTAYREGSEELSGYLGDRAAIKKRVEQQGKVYKIIHNDYHIHMFFMEYDENLPKYYNNSHTFLWKKMDKTVLNDSKLFEKIEIRWFSENELKSQRSLFRPFYREMVDKMHEQLPQIRAFIDSKKKPTKRTRKVRFVIGDEPTHRPIERTLTPFYTDK